MEVRSTPSGSPDIASTDTELTLKRMNTLVRQHKEGYALSDGTQRVERIYTYEYADGRFDRRGHGWLGFSKRAITERDSTGQQRSRLDIEYGRRSERYRTNATTEPVEKYVYPYAGLATRYTMTTALVQSEIGNLAQRTTDVEVDWQVKLSAVAQHPFPYMTARRTRVTEDNALLAQTQETFDVDEFGNQKLHSIVDKQSVTTNTIYNPGATRIANWLISLPREQTIQSTRNGVSADEAVWFFHDDTTGLLEVVDRERNNAALRQTTTFTHNDFGNVQLVEVEAAGEPPRSTAFTFDPQQIYPATVTNAKLQTTELRYDPRHGAASIVVDSNKVGRARLSTALAGCRTRRTQLAA